jgi:hypothetical protein
MGQQRIHRLQALPRLTVCPLTSATSNAASAIRKPCWNGLRDRVKPVSVIQPHVATAMRGAQGVPSNVTTQSVARCDPMWSVGTSNVAAVQGVPPGREGRDFLSAVGARAGFVIRMSSATIHLKRHTRASNHTPPRLVISREIGPIGVVRGIRWGLDRRTTIANRCRPAAGDTRSPSDIPDKVGVRQLFRNVLRVAVKR